MKKLRRYYFLSFDTDRFCDILIKSTLENIGMLSRDSLSADMPARQENILQASQFFIRNKLNYLINDLMNWLYAF